jgi:hypothetical protein
MIIAKESMRKLSILFILFPSIVFAQHKWDNQIIIRGTSIEKCASVFLDKGYTINKYDTLLGFFTTKPKALNKHRLISKFVVRVKGDSAFVTGEYCISGNPYALLPRDEAHIAYRPITFFNSKLSDSKFCWNVMQSICAEISNNLDFAKL